ncbi:hypothetical protein Ancab_029609, partial [Ancistrocladus abbreviatus]
SSRESYSNPTKPTSRKPSKESQKQKQHPLTDYHPQHPKDHRKPAPSDPSRR